jgi:TRAP-type C4-dicarboxylate transport system, small permease component
VLKVLNRSLDHLEEWLIAALIAAATGLIFVAVLHRYGTGVSIDLSKWLAARGVPVLPVILKDIYLWLAALDVSWAQELCIYMFIWMAKFGAAYGVYVPASMSAWIFSSTRCRRAHASRSSCSPCCAARFSPE